MPEQYLTNSDGQTKKIAKILAQKIFKSFPKKKAIVIGLIGDLGSGKTTFLQGFAKGLGIKERILSPTFVIMRKFQIESGEWKVESRKKTTRHPLPSTLYPPPSTLYSLPSTFYHFDCYRVSKPKEILDLGFKEIISDPQNIVAIEWVDRVHKILPKDALILEFEFVDKNIRKITIISTKNLKL